MFDGMAISLSRSVRHAIVIRRRDVAGALWMQGRSAPVLFPALPNEDPLQ
jgi:hypothetical protein